MLRDISGLRNMEKWLYGLGLALVVAGCSTPEFKNERNICTSTWMSKIPPNFIQEQYNKRQSRQVSTGRTICRKVINSFVCDEQMTTEYYTVPAVRTVDTNEARRDAQISVCTQKRCVQKFGNSECKG